MKLELNVPALERLIGGDTEIEISLRENIVKEFAKRHLKEVAESESYAAALDEVRKLVNASIKEHFGVDGIVTKAAWPTIDFRLKSLIEDLVNKYAQAAVDKAVEKIITYQRGYFGEVISARVKKEMDRRIEQEISEGIQKRLAIAAGQVGDNAAG